MSEKNVSGMQGCQWEFFFEKVFKPEMGLVSSNLNEIKFKNTADQKNDEGLSGQGSEKFIFFYARPEYCLARDRSISLDLWSRDASLVLDFVHSHREDSLLLDMEQCQIFPDECFRLISSFLDAAPMKWDSYLPKTNFDAGFYCDQLEILSNLILQKRIEGQYNDLFVSAPTLGDGTYQPIDKRINLLAGYIKDALANMVDKSLTEDISKLKERLKSLELELDEKQQTFRNKEDEQELSILQIHQLQEELEHYYSEYIDLQSKHADLESKHTDLEKNYELEKANALSPMPGKSSCLVANAGKGEIVGSFTIEDYSDIHIKLYDLFLADGRQFPEFQFKIILNSGCAGIELRPQPGEDENFINWPEGMTDEYGPYLMVIPDPIEEQVQEQQDLLNFLSSADYNLIEASLQALNNLWYTENIENPESLESSILRHWKLTACECLRQLSKKPSQIHFDKVRLKEHSCQEDYEHLWLELENLRFGTQYFSKYDFKLMVSSLSEDPLFASHASLSFRELGENKLPPLQTWPSDIVDEYGSELLYQIDLKGKSIGVEGVEALAEQDLIFIHALIDELPQMVLVISEVSNCSRPIEQWHTLAKALVEIKSQLDEKQTGIIYRALKKGLRITRSVFARQE